MGKEEKYFTKEDTYTYTFIYTYTYVVGGFLLCMVSVIPPGPVSV